MSGAHQPVSTKTMPLDSIEANFPPALLDAPIWLLHRHKQPFYADGTPRRGTLDVTDDRARLVTYRKARSALLIHPADGVGVALGPIAGSEINLCGIDLDGCYVEGQLQAQAQQILSAANSYAERSPSGNGMHILGIGAVGTTKKSGLEIYSGKRYFTVTGDTQNGAGLADISEVVALARRLFGCDAPPESKTPTNGTPQVNAVGPLVVEGNRNNFLMSEAGKLRRIELHPKALHAAVHELNRNLCQPPLPNQEVDAIAQGILRYPSNSEAATPTAPGAFTPIPDHAFINRPPLEWLIKGVLPRCGLAIVYGPSGSGKSFLVLAMLAAVATGNPWHGRKTAKARAVFVLAEGVGGFHSRLKAYAAEHGSLPGVSITAQAPHLLDSGQCQQLSAEILHAGGADIIVIDTLMAASPGADENAAKDMGRIIDNCKQISATCNATVILVHHSGKDESRGARGWSGLKAAADAEIEVGRAGIYHTARVSKLKDGEDGATFAFKLRPVLVGIDADGEPIKSCTVEPVTEPVQPAKPKEPRQGTLAHKVLGILRNSEKGPDGWIPSSQVVEAVANQLPRPPGRDTRTQKIVRALESLAVGGHIKVEGDRCLLT